MLTETWVQTILDLRRMDRPCKNKKDNKLTVKLKTAWNYIMKVLATSLPPDS